MKNYASLIKALCNSALLLCVLLGASVNATELVGKVVPATATHSSALASQSSSSVAATETEFTIETKVSSNDDSKEPEDEIQDAMEDIGHQIEKNANHGADVIIPIVAMLLLFGGPIVLIIAVVALRYRAKASRQQSINANIDKLLAAGRDIPVELLRGDEPYIQMDDYNLHKGLRNLGLGIGLLIFLTILCGIKIGAVGFIFIGLGISRVLIWWLSGNKITATHHQE